MNLRVIILLVVAVLHGFASAQPVNSPWASASQSVQNTIRSAAHITPGEAADIAFARNGITRAIPTMGRVNPYTGALVISTGLISAGLTWYMTQATDAISGTSLDDCRSYSSAHNLSSASMCTEVYDTPKAPSVVCQAPTGGGADDNATVRCAGTGGFGQTADEVSFTAEWSGYYKAFTQYRWFNNPCGRSGGGSVSSMPFHIQQFQNSFASCSPVKTPVSLEDYKRGTYKDGVPHPDLDDGLAKIINRYIDAVPLGDAATIATPIPGVTLDPIPTPDQIVDAPETGPVRTISTVTTTTRNPDGSTTKTTTTSYSDGTKKIVKITTGKAVTTNPDGSSTTKTTVTTETTKLDSDGALEPGYPKTTTETAEETTPAPEPPPTDEPTCTTKGGSWTAGTGDAPGSCVMPVENAPLPGQQTLPELDKSAFKMPDFGALKTNFDTKLGTMKQTASDKFPFGIGQKWFAPLTVGSGECPAFPVKLGPLDLDFTPCNSPVANTFHGTVRPVLLLILLACIGLLCVRAVAQS